MGLSTLLMTELCKRLKPGDRIASCGYPDILASPKEIESILGDRFCSLKYRDDSGSIHKWHHGSKYVPKHGVADAKLFFELQGATFDVYDVVEHRGGEIVCDLNVPMDALDYNYDFVLDIGTIEHCFNIGVAACNMVGLLKKGGIILHENPFNWGNHGFYNINPTWYQDFYSQPGFELLDMRMIKRNCPEDGQQVEGVLKTKRFRYIASEANMIAIARRNEVLPILFPVQSKYARKIAELQAAPAAGDLGRQAAAG